MGDGLSVFNIRYGALASSVLARRTGQTCVLGASGTAQGRDGGKQFAGLVGALSIINFFADACVLRDASLFTRAPGGSKPISASHSIVFSAARFADPSQRFARGDAQGHFVHRPHPACCGQFYGEAANFEQIAHAAILKMKLGK